MSASKVIDFNKIKSKLRDFFAPHFCTKGKHRWVISKGVAGFFMCRDCGNFVAIEASNDR